MISLINVIQIHLPLVCIFSFHHLWCSKSLSDTITSLQCCAITQKKVMTQRKWLADIHILYCLIFLTSHEYFFWCKIHHKFRIRGVHWLISLNFTKVQSNLLWRSSLCCWVCTNVSMSNSHEKWKMFLVQYVFNSYIIYKYLS